ncbi:MAG: hypothetical protein P4L87_22500 [Formivibrio sp.]|nr:hypothetical protein [Formivibrio sp.]
MWNVGGQLGSVLLYAGLGLIPNVASALGKGAVAAVQSVLPAGNTYNITNNYYNNPAHLGSRVDTRA